MSKLKNQSLIASASTVLLSFIDGSGPIRFFSALSALSEEAPEPLFSHNNFPADNNLVQQQHSPPSSPQFSPSTKFYLSALIGCTTLSDIKKVHARVAANGVLITDLAVANKLLLIYVRYGALGDAHKLFDGIPERNAVSWSVMIGGFARNHDYTNCFKTFREYIRSRQRLDVYTLPSVIRVCRDTMDLEMGRLIHHAVFKHGLHLDPYVCAALVDMYAKCGVMDSARQLFDRIAKRDLTTWTVMIGAYTGCGNAGESLVLFDRMREEGFVPDKITMVTVVNACAKFGAMHKAKLIHDVIRRQNINPDVILGSAMIDMYAKCGSLDSAREIFDGMREKNVISWSALIAAYGYHGQGRKVPELFDTMLRSGISPNKITFLSLLYACSHSGLIEEGIQFFSSMQEEYFIRPDVKHYTCMVDLLGRAGRLDQAVNVIENMTVERDEGLWGALIGACRIHNHVELAEKAAESLLELQPHNPGHYVLLSNIYAKAGKWEDAAKIRSLMTSRSVKKVPGWTRIEAGNVIYSFTIGDYRHSRSKEIYEKLEVLSKKLEEAGYVPDTNFVLHDVDEELKPEILSTHSEKLAIAFGLIALPERTPIRIWKNLRVCGDCHTYIKYVSVVERREIIVRDAKRFHHLKEGVCSCGDYW